MRRSQQGDWRQQPAREKENPQWSLGATERQYFSEAVSSPVKGCPQRHLAMWRHQ